MIFCVDKCQWLHIKMTLMLRGRNKPQQAHIYYNNKVNVGKPHCTKGKKISHQIHYVSVALVLSVNSWQAAGDMQWHEVCLWVTFLTLEIIQGKGLTLLFKGRYILYRDLLKVEDFQQCNVKMTICISLLLN